MPSANKKRRRQTVRELRLIRNRIEKLGKTSGLDIKDIIRKMSSMSGSKSKKNRPGKSAGARKPVFLDSSDYVNESSIPTVEELSQNPKAYLHQYKIDSKDAYLEKGSKIVHPRVTVRNRVKIFRYNGNKYTHWSMTEEGIQNLVNKSSPGKTKFKKGDVIKMDTEDEDGQLYIVGKNQKLEEAIGVLAILLGQDDENEEAEKVRKEYPGSYEHLWTHLDAAIARYIDQYL